MSSIRILVLASLLAACAGTLFAQPGQITPGPMPNDNFHTVYLRLDGADDALLYEPVTPAANARIALLLSHPDGNTFASLPAVEIAKRGYRVLTVNHHGNTNDLTVFAQPLSRAIGYLRTLPGVQRVVLMGHSGGGPLMAWYANLSEHGPAACQGAEKLYPCDGKQLTGLDKPDGVILLDSTLGAFHAMSAIDPAVDGDRRIAALDMFTPANGYDLTAKRATYSADFARRFYAAQSARNAALLGNALARLQALQQGKAQFSDDEPMVIRGMGADAAGARLYQPDPSFAAHTREPHTLLKADGTQPVAIVPSVRPPTGQQFAAALDSLLIMNQATTVRMFLAHSAIRTTSEFAITADDILGVDWASAVTSAPANAEGITVPALVMANSCHYLMVPDEIVFNHLASKDKTLAFVEGSTHIFTPCKPEYGDTVKRAFDYVAQWLAKPERF